MAADSTGTMQGTGVARGVVIWAVAAWVLLPLSFLATGGSLRWWEAWTYCAILLVPMTVFLLTVARRDPEFLARRLQMKEKERQQRRVLAWGIPVLLAAFIIPGLDRRFGWRTLRRGWSLPRWRHRSPVTSASSGCSGRTGGRAGRWRHGPASRSSPPGPIDWFVIRCTPRARSSTSRPPWPSGRGGPFCRPWRSCRCTSSGSGTRKTCWFAIPPATANTESWCDTGWSRSSGEGRGARPRPGGPARPGYQRRRRGTRGEGLQRATRGLAADGADKPGPLGRERRDPGGRPRQAATGPPSSTR